MFAERAPCSVRHTALYKPNLNTDKTLGGGEEKGNANGSGFTRRSARMESDSAQSPSASPTLVGRHPHRSTRWFFPLFACFVFGGDAGLHRSTSVRFA